MEAGSPGGPCFIGVLSDTHGRLHPAIHEVFHGACAVIHAGDLGSPDVLWELQTIAPVTAVRGNVDKGGWAGELPDVAETRIGGTSIRVAHLRSAACRRPLPGDCGLVVFGHTHVPLTHSEGGILLLNPGSATSGRSGSGRSVAIVRFCDGHPDARILHL